MTLEFVDNYINKKILENKNFIKYTFYELRIKCNLSKEEVKQILELSKIYLEQKGYNIYFTGDEYIYQNKCKIVKDNELMVAIRQD